MDVVALTERLVAAPSYDGVGEGQAAEVARQAMLALGYLDVGIDPAGNVTGRMPGNGSAPGVVVFDGHLDTVGVGDAAAWTSAPFVPARRMERLYGRGTADMKGAIAAMICGVAALRDDPAACDVVVSASVAEELVEGVAFGYVLDRYPAKAVVIGESTNLTLARGQRGRAELLIETRGEPAHSSTPHLGVNAVKRMATLVTVLSGLPMPRHPLLGPAVLEVTDILSDPYPGLSVIPERCRATFDRRTLVDEVAADILDEIQGVIAALAADDPDMRAEVRIAEDRFHTYTGYEIIAPNFAPAWMMEDDAPIVERGIAALVHAGLAPLLSHYAFCTNGSESAGRRGIPTIGFGPGEEAQAHRIDESIDIAHLHVAETGYEMLARELALL